MRSDESPETETEDRDRDKYRALLTDREAEILSGDADVDESYYYRVVSRVRDKIETLADDLDVIERHPTLADELRNEICGAYNRIDIDNIESIEARPIRDLRNQHTDEAPTTTERVGWQLSIHTETNDHTIAIDDVGIDLDENMRIRGHEADIRPVSYYDEGINHQYHFDANDEPDDDSPDIPEEGLEIEVDASSAEDELLIDFKDIDVFAPKLGAYDTRHWRMEASANMDSPTPNQVTSIPPGHFVEDVFDQMPDEVREKNWSDARIVTAKGTAYEEDIAAQLMERLDQL